MAKHDCRHLRIILQSHYNMPQRYLICLGWLIILALATWLRVDGLAERPMHADEATGARILSTRLDSNNYSFDPKHYHGPFLTYSSTLLSALTGEHSWKALTKTGLRVDVVLAGLLLVLSPLVWLRQIGHPAALTAAALLASSPLLVYYNRMYIHESWLVLFAMLACGWGYQFLQRPTRPLAILTGISIGLMFATKETFVISVLSWGAASSLYWAARQQQWLEPQAPPAFRTYISPTILLALSAAFISVVFYSNGFRSLDGVIDAVRTYFVYETSAGHDKSFVYYLELLLWPKHRLGQWWTEIAVALLGTFATAAAFLQRQRRGAALFLSVATCTHIIIYSIISYKTPWLMLVPWAHACLLAGLALQQLNAFSRSIQVAAVLLFAVTMLYQAQQSLRSSGPYANDARNPYAYVPTSKDIESLEHWFIQLQELTAPDPLKPLAVIGSGYWPLPWYLRTFETVGYWTQPTDAMCDYPIVIAMSEHEAATNELLLSTHVALPRGLRNNVSMTVYLHNDLWKQWNEVPNTP